MTDTPVNPETPDTNAQMQEPPMDNDAGHARIAILEEEVQSLKDRVLRTMAEMENLRRRTEKEKADASVYAIAKFARDMLNVSDNLSRALSAVPTEARENGDEAIKALIEGVELTERDMLNQMERHNVKRLSPKGEKFDPNFHQAMFEAVNPAVPNGTVMEVVQDGFVIGDRVLRPALVGVAKGGPKMAAAPQEAENIPDTPEETTAEPDVDTAPQRSGAGERVDRSI